MHYMQLHAITCNYTIWSGCYAPYTPCQGMFWPPNEASLTQTNPATAHLFPRPPSATRANSSWFAARAALLSCLKPGSRVHPVAISPSRPGIQSAFCPLTRHSLGRRPLPGRRYSAAVFPAAARRPGVPGPGPPGHRRRSSASCPRACWPNPTQLAGCSSILRQTL